MVACAETLAAERKVKCHFARAGGNNITNGITDACWFGWQTMEERNSSNTATCQYVWGNYLDECIQINLLQPAGPQQLPIDVYYPLQDTLYRTMALANSSGTPVEAYDTDAYGNTIIFTGAGPDKTWFTDDDTQSSYGASDVIYCGYRYDAETENYYVRNWYYSPTLGRWLTRDPIGYRGGINHYGYVESSPVGNVDAVGLAGPAIAGTVSPSTPPTSPPGITPVPPGGTSPTSPSTEPNTASVGVTGTTGPVPIAPGVTGSVGATGTITSQGNYTGSATGKINILAPKGAQVTVKVTAKATGSLTSQKAPGLSVGAKCTVRPTPAFPVEGYLQGILTAPPGEPNQIGNGYSIGAGVSSYGQSGGSWSFGVSLTGAGGQTYFGVGAAYSH